MISRRPGSSSPLAHGFLRAAAAAGAGRVAGAALAAALLLAPAVLAQGPPNRPPGPVRYTEAREQSVRKTITLPGSVQSRTMSTVATEVEGLVIDLPVREGDRVKSGQVLARLRTSTLELQRQQVAGQLKEAKARLDQAVRQLKRAEELFESKVMSQSQLDEASSEKIATEGRVDALASQLSRLDLDLAHMTIRAPFAGAVTARRTEVGQWIDVGGPVVDLVALDQMEVKVDVPERWFAGLERGSEATVTFEALPGVTLTGTIVGIVPRASLQARAFPVRVRIPNPHGRIGVGMLAEVALPSGEEERATLVPKDAVVGAGADQHVYLIDGNSHVAKVPVATGAGYGDWIVVRGEVRPGAKVVTRGNERLMPGMPVKGEPLAYALPEGS